MLKNIPIPYEKFREESLQNHNQIPTLVKKKNTQVAYMKDLEGQKTMSKSRVTSPVALSRCTRTSFMPVALRATSASSAGPANSSECTNSAASAAAFSPPTSTRSEGV